jgi:sulfite reductase alpha subunit-like flavoprotein
MGFASFFIYTTKNFSGSSPCTSVLKAIEEYLPCYEKGDRALFETLLPKLESAISNAKRLKQHHSDTDTKSKNPSTDLHEFVDYLTKLKS